MPPAAGGGGGGAVTDLDWSSTLGLGLGTMINGGGNKFINAGAGAPDGDLFVAGNTTDDDFPANTGTTPHAGAHDFIFGRFDYAPGDPVNDASRLWMSYFGGTDNEKPTVIHHSNNGNLYVAGWTSSDDLFLTPAVDPNDGTYWQGYLKGNTDGLIVKADPSNGFVLRSTYFGGDGNDMITAVTEDSGSNIYFAGVGNSTNGQYNNCNSTATGFPMCETPAVDYQQLNNTGGTDGFLMKLDATFHLKYSTLYGGYGDDLIYDAAYDNNAVNPDQQYVILVGSTTQSIPTGTGGSYYIPGTGSGGISGFIATFNPNGAIRWCTTVHGLRALEAAAVKDNEDRLTVMGFTTYEPPTSNSCSPTAGVLNICDPGNGAYIDSTVEFYDHYYADFNVPTGTMLWSTVHGEDADDAATFTDTIEYASWQYHPFRVHRYADLEIDADGNRYGLGIVEQSLSHTPHHFPTVPAYGFFNKDFDPNTGDDQTDVTLSCFKNDRTRYWSSTYGSRFDHIGDTTNITSDVAFRFEGCDWGHDLVLIENEALYWVGTTGGTDLDHACPPSTLAWCEDQLPYAHGGDVYNGFVARMNLSGLNIGIDEGTGTAGPTIVCYPNPAADALYFAYNGAALMRGTVKIYDALGKVVVNDHTGNEGAVTIGHLATGTYHALLFDSRARYLGSVRFAKQK